MSDPDEYCYFSSAVGNAFFSGLSFEQVWSCILIAADAKQFDAAISATIALNELSTNRRDFND
jgi:hypothetical protein